MAIPSIGKTQPARAAERFKAIEKGACLDVYFRYAKHEHSINANHTAATAKMFARIDLAYCPFIYTPDYKGKEFKKFKKIVKDLFALKIGKASKAINKIIEKSKKEEEILIAKKLKEKVDARVKAIIEIMETLKEEDAALCSFYGNIFNKQLKGHSDSSKIKNILKEAKKTKKFKASVKCHYLLTKKIIGFLEGTGKVKSDARKTLEKILKIAGEKSLAGEMASNLLSIP